jgi:hypothetical protein
VASLDGKEKKKERKKERRRKDNQGPKLLIENVLMVSL